MVFLESINFSQAWKCTQFNASPRQCRHENLEDITHVTKQLCNVRSSDNYFSELKTYRIVFYIYLKHLLTCLFLIVITC